LNPVVAPHGCPWPGGAVQAPALTSGSGVTHEYGDTQSSAVEQAAPAGSSGLQTSCVAVTSAKSQTVPSTHSASVAEQSPPAGTIVRATHVPAQQTATHPSVLQRPRLAHSSLKKQVPPGGTVPVKTWPHSASSERLVAAIAVSVQAATPLNVSTHARAARASYATVPAAISTFIVAKKLSRDCVDATQVASSG